MFEKEGEGRCYYRMNFNYAPKQIDLLAVNYGFLVERNYEFVDHKDDVIKVVKTIFFLLIILLFL